MISCDYLHCYHNDNWSRCPPDCGPVDQYGWIDKRGKILGTSHYCQLAAEEANNDPRPTGLIGTRLVRLPSGDRK